jgi:hypothetical protein
MPPELSSSPDDLEITPRNQLHFVQLLVPFVLVSDEVSPDPRDRIYDPLRRVNLGRSVQWALLAREPVRINRIPVFDGCGIYALYYAGPLPLYSAISSVDCKVPIYVGKADPEGARKGLNVRPAWEGRKLRNRLIQHGRKIEASNDFDADQFYVRYLPADDLFTLMAERLMISGYHPVWNLALDGFGVNPQGGRREAEQLRPAWHELHRGVPWAERMTPHQHLAHELRLRVSAHLARYHEPSPGNAVPGAAALSDDDFDSSIVTDGPGGSPDVQFALDE